MDNIMQNQEWSREDRDLLIELRTEMRGMRTDIKDLKDGTSNQITDLTIKTEELETHKASKVDLDNVITRLDRVTNRQNLMIGGLIVINVLLPFIYKYVFEK